MSLCTPRDWQQIALREAAELLGTSDGAAKLAEARRYGACADEIVRLQAMCAQSDGRVELLAGELARLQRELADLRRAQALGVAATPELIGVALDALATPADDVGELP